MKNADKNNRKKFKKDKPPNQNDNQINDFILKYTNKMKSIQEKVLSFLENEDAQNNLSLLTYHLSLAKIGENKADLKAFLYLLLNISDNHQRTLYFFDKIEAIISYYKSEITKHLSNFEIFNIFKNNKRILFFLFKNKVIIPDQNISQVICNKKYANKKYPQYFATEIEPFLNEKNHVPDLEDPEDFDLKRTIGENDNYICKLIRNDSIVDFIAFVNQTNLSLNNEIQPSIFETNQFLIDKTPSLIEYATFFGSVQILRYLIYNDVKLSSSLWIFAIHSNNPEIIHLLEESHVKPNDLIYFESLIESIKCHHIAIANYIKDNLLNLKNYNEILRYCLRYHNFSFIMEMESHEVNLFINFFCKFEQTTNLDHIINATKYDANSKIIENSEETTKEKTLLIIAIKNQNIEILKSLINKYNVDVNCKNIKINKKVIETNSIYKSEQIYEKSVEKSPLAIAIEKRNINIVQLLLSHPKIDINSGIVNNSLEYEKVLNKIINQSVEKYQEIKSPLIMAIENNLLDIFQLFLSTKSNIYSKYSIYNSYYRKSMDIPNFVDDKRLYEEIIEKDPLIIAIEKGNLNISCALLSKSKDMTKSKYIKKIKYGYYEETCIEKEALICAIENDNLEIIKLLLTQKNIDVNKNMINRFGMPEKLKNKFFYIDPNALIIAVANEKENIIELLLKQKDINVNAKCTIYEKPNDPEDNDFCFYTCELTCIRKEKSALYIAVENENEKISKLLLKSKGIQINTKLKHEEYVNVIDGKKKIESNLNYEKSEFILAVEKGNPVIVKYFLKYLNLNINSVFELSSKSKIYEITQIEKYKKREEKCEEMTPLHIAIQNGFIKIVKLLLSKSNVNKKYICQKNQIYKQMTREKNKRVEKTALHIAIENQQFEIIHLLLSKSNIDINSKYIKSSNLYNKPKIKTALFLAVETNNKDIIKCLLQNSKIKITDDLKNNPLIKTLLTK